MAKRVSNTTKATATIGVSGALATYGAAIVSQKTGIPLEVTAPVLGGLFAWLGRWAAKLNPND